MLVIENSSAIGIGPPKVEVDFQPNLNKEITFMVLNQISIPIRAELYVRGDLAEYITLEKEYIDLDPGKSATFQVYITLPSKIDTPGPNNLRIGALESQITSEAGTVGAKAGVESKLIINVPYEGKYIKADLKATDIKKGEIVDFTLSISNIGEEYIADLDASIEIYDSDDEKIATIKTDSISISSGEKKDIAAKWSSEDAEAGIYNAIAKITYDGNAKEAETKFRIGDVLIEILDVSISKFKKGEIAGISLSVQSKWNEEIKDVFADIEIYQGDELVDSIETNKITLGSWEKKTLNAYWNTANIKKGDYTAKAVLNYANQTTYKEFGIEVKSGFEFGTITIIISIPVLFFILWWIFWAKKIL